MGRLAPPDCRLKYPKRRGPIKLLTVGTTLSADKTIPHLGRTVRAYRLQMETLLNFSIFEVIGGCDRFVA
jgi:hypothetical protein